MNKRDPSSSDRESVLAILLRFQTEYQLSGNVLSDEEIAQMCQVACSTSVMACSVLGSFLSQEVIKAVSCTGAPGYNVFVFTGHDFVAKAIPIC